MGSHQENWFYNQLSKSAQRGATWRVVGNQIVFSHIIEASGESGDNWNVSPPMPRSWPTECGLFSSYVMFFVLVKIPDTFSQGYVANRNRTLKHLYDNHIGNNVFLSGDSHQNWVRQPLLPYYRKQRFRRIQEQS